MVSPGLLVGNSRTMATTPFPKRIRTNVPNSSATTSANKDGFEVIVSPRWLPDREVVYQGWARGQSLRFPSRSGKNGCHRSCNFGRGSLRRNSRQGTLPLDISGQSPKIGNIYSLL